MVQKKFYLRGKKTISIMGRKRKEKPGIESLHSSISRMPVPEYILSGFEMQEKEDRIPEALSIYPDAVFEGCHNPAEMQGHIFVAGRSVFAVTVAK
jgi:hypothetical protein